MGIRQWGKPGKAGKGARPEQVPDARGGRPSPGNAIAAPGWRYGADPLAFSYAHRLGVATSLTSPMVRGRFRPLEGADPTRTGNGRPDLGALQTFRGLVGAATQVRLGMQAGPSAPPGYPSTGQGGVIGQLAAMQQPGIRIGGL